MKDRSFLNSKDVTNFEDHCGRFRLEMIKIRDKCIPGSNNEIFLNRVIDFVSEAYAIGFAIRHDVHWNRINSEFYEYLVNRNKEQAELIENLRDTINSLNAVISEMEITADRMNKNPFVKTS